MKVITTVSYEESCQVLAQEIIDLVNQKPDACLGFATGSSPLGIYRLLIEANKAGKVNFSKVRTVNLDEYVGLSPDHPQSYRYFMNTNLFDHINIDKANTFVPNGKGGAEALEAFRKTLDDVTVDYQLLGVGQNGHVGFNEPADALSLRPYMVTLDESTIEANAIFFEDKTQVPRQAFTMGMGDIMNAKKIGIIVSGKKQEAMRRLLTEETISALLPISLVKLHPCATLVAEQSILP